MLQSGFFDPEDRFGKFPLEPGDFGLEVVDRPAVANHRVTFLVAGLYNRLDKVLVDIGRRVVASGIVNS